jgi:nicotinamide mononucleotide transporter
MNDLCAWLVANGTSCLELLGFITGVVNVWLVTRENIWNWPVGILNALFYTVVFARSGLYSDTGLQVVYFVLSCYGWWHWSRGTRHASPVVVRRASAPTLARLGFLGVAIWFALKAVTSRIPGAMMPGVDAALVATSVIAQAMMTRKLLENWILWILVDAAYIVVFVIRGLVVTSVLYAVFLCLAGIGLVQWSRSARRTQAHLRVQDPGELQGGSQSESAGK